MSRFEDWYALNADKLDGKRTIKQLMEEAFEAGEMASVTFPSEVAKENPLFDAWLNTVGAYADRFPPTREQADAIVKEVRARVSNAADGVHVLARTMGQDDYIFLKYPVSYHLYRIFDNVGKVVDWLYSKEGQERAERIKAAGNPVNEAL